MLKVEPEHLGVGMYQHDLPPKALREALNAVVEECVSFVGVNLNSASPHLLQKARPYSPPSPLPLATCEYR